VLGGLLAIVVLYLFLRDARTTLITSVAIPVSVVGTFMLMYMSDLSLNIMSLGGLALAVGMLVDNAVVVLEAIVRKREHGMSRIEAAQSGTREVSTAVTAATLTSVAVFFPMVFISGIAGQLFKDQALTVTYSLLLSLAVALTLVPMLAAGGDPEKDAGEADVPQQKPLGRISAALSTALAAIGRVAGTISRTMERLFRPAVDATQALYLLCERLYPPAIRWALTHRITVLFGSLALFLLTMLIVPQLGSELVPQISQGEFNIDLRLAAGTPLEVTDQAVSRVQMSGEQLPNLALSYAVAGTGNRLDANPVDAGENTGRVSITLGHGAPMSRPPAPSARTLSRPPRRLPQQSTHPHTLGGVHGHSPRSRRPRRRCSSSPSPAASTTRPPPSASTPPRRRRPRRLLPPRWPLRGPLSLRGPATRRRDRPVLLRRHRQRLPARGRRSPHRRRPRLQHHQRRLLQLRRRPRPRLAPHHPPPERRPRRRRRPHRREPGRPRLRRTPPHRRPLRA
jgi:multidrug efflux pump subunit AcrB